MIRRLQIIVVCLVFLGGKTFAQAGKSQLVLFTDRDYCVSGDTVWFKVFAENTSSQSGNVIRVQLDKNGEHYIAGAAKKAENNRVEGFIKVPDSVSTGLYFVTAFLNAQRNTDNLQLQTNTLMVYNRFTDALSEIQVLEKLPEFSTKNSSTIPGFTSNKEMYNSREKVTFEVEVEKSELKYAVIKAELLDPISAGISGKYYFTYNDARSEIPDFAEYNGILISGTISDANSIPKQGVLTLLSVPGEQSYLDYYVTGSNGDFHYFLKNAEGTTNAIIQAVNDTENEYRISSTTNFIQQTNPLLWQSKTLTLEQSKFVSELVNSNFFTKLFTPETLSPKLSFTMPVPFDMPFYGHPTTRIIPDDFIELPNFKEISRELLQGVQYRERRGEITFRMFNQKRGTYFSDEPLRLINGIPVFKNSYFSNLGSNDINFIDVVQSERVYGDLLFNGILEVNLKDKSNAWMAQQKNIRQVKIDALQPNANFAPDRLVATESNLPDLRKNFLWKELEPGKKQSFEFHLSDMKGKVKISVEGITHDNRFYHASKIILVQ